MAGSKPAALPLGDTPASVRTRGKARGRASYSRISRAARPPAARAAATYSGRAPRSSSSGPGRGPPCARHRSPLAHAANTQDPVPVSRAGANRPSQSSASATAGNLARTTGSQSLRPPDSKKARIVMQGGISCQFRALEDLPGARRRPRDGSSRTRPRAARRGSAAPPPLPPRRKNPEQKQAHPRPAAGPSAASSSSDSPQPHRLLSASEHRRRIRAAPAQAPAQGDALGHPQARPARRPGRAPSAPAPPAPTRSSSADTP